MPSHTRSRYQFGWLEKDYDAIVSSLHSALTADLCCGRHSRPEPD